MDYLKSLGLGVSLVLVALCLFFAFLNIGKAGEKPIYEVDSSTAIIWPMKELGTIHSIGHCKDGLKIAGVRPNGLIFSGCFESSRERFLGKSPKIGDRLLYIAVTFPNRKLFRELFPVSGISFMLGGIGDRTTEEENRTGYFYSGSSMIHSQLRSFLEKKIPEYNLLMIDAIHP